MGDQNKNVPRLRFPGYTDAWVKCTIKDVVKNISDGDWIEKEHIFNHGAYRIIQTGNIGVGEFQNKFENAKYINQVDFEELRANEIFPGDVLISRLAEPAGRTIILPETGYRMVTAVDVAVIRPNTSFDSYFIKTIMNSKKILDIVLEHVSGSTHKRISRKNLEIVKLFVPSKKEQQVIGEFFKHLDDLITVNERELNKLKDLKKSYLEKMFPKNGSDIPELRFPGYADAWVKCELGEVANYRNGRAHEQSISDDGEYVVINSKFVSTSGLVRKYSMVQNEPLRNGEIVFVLSDVPNGKALARTFLVTEDNKYTLNQRIAGITPFENIDSYFLYFLMNRHPYFTQFDDGVGQTNLSKNDVENFEESYPSGEEQAKIGEFFKHLDDLITVNERELNKLKELKKSYLKDMFV